MYIKLLHLKNYSQSLIFLFLSCLSISVFAADVGDYGQVTGLYDPNEILPVYMGNGIDVQDVAFCIDVNSSAPQVGDYYTVVNPIGNIPNHNELAAVLNAIYDGYDLYPGVQQAIWYFSNPGYNPTSTDAQTIINLVNNGTYQPIPDVAWLSPDNTARQPLLAVNRPTCSFDLSGASVSVSQPTGCTPSYDGQFTISNVQPNETYSVTYIDDGVLVGPLNLTADGSGTLLISGLDPGNYNTLEITSTTEPNCFQCFSQANGYNLVYNEVSACPISGPSATIQTQTAAPTTATSNNCEPIAATWNSPENALTNDGQIASVTLSQALLGTRASHCLHLTNLGLSIPECAVINGVEVTIGGTSTVADAEDRIIRLLDASGNYIGNNQAISNWPTAGTNTYGGSSNTWGAGSSLTPTLLNSSGFGVIVKVGVPVALFNNAEVTLGVDYMEMTVHYSLPEVCSEAKVPFSVASSPDAVNYTWYGPTGTLVDSGQGTNAAVIDMNNVAPGCYDICVDVELQCTGTETCCYTVNTVDCCPNITTITDNGVDACYSGTPIDVTYTVTTDYGTNGTEYTTRWYVDGVEQTGQTGDQFVYSITPSDGCTVITNPDVTAQLYCTQIGEVIGTPISSTSAGYSIYPTPVEGVDFTISETTCIVEVIDNCGTLDITNDQGTGASYTLVEGDPDQVVNFVLRSDANAPAGCEATAQGTAICVTYDIAITKSAAPNTAAIGDQITYTIDVYNEGTGELTGLLVTDTLSTSLLYTGVYTATQGTFDGLHWNIGNIAVGDSASIDIIVTVVELGVIINDAEIIAMNEIDVDSYPSNAARAEDDLGSACVSPMVEICTTDSIDVTLTAAAGYTTYQWYRDSTAISGATSQIYNATEIGEYYYIVDENVPGSCPGELCCPVIITQVDCCPPPQCIPITVTRIRLE